MSIPRSVKGLIFDLGDVLFTWSAHTNTTISAEVLKKILSSPTWFEYESGRLSQDNCYERVATEFAVEASQVAEAFAQARASLQPNNMIVEFLRNVKRNSLAKVYAMSNVSKEDFAALAGKMDWSLFDGVFTSGAAGMRKPDSNFYRYVLESIGLEPKDVLFVDDRRENVQAAEDVGISSLVFDEATVGTLQAFFDDPVGKGYRYLYRNANQFDSVTDSGVVVQDNFAKLLILEAIRDKSLVHVGWDSKKTWNFFAGEASLIPGGCFPDDLDTTSLALTVLPPKDPQLIAESLDNMADYVNSDGTVQTYYDRGRPRTDGVVSANVLACFYKFGRGSDLSRTLQYVHDLVFNRMYAQGTRYYPSPDCCLGFFVRLLQFSRDDCHLQATLRPLLRSRVQERVGGGGSALDLALRIVACDELGIDYRVDCDTLLDLQLEDGSWEPGWMYSYGSTGVRIGNQGVTTAFAIKAIALSMGSRDGNM